MSASRREFLRQGTAVAASAAWLYAAESAHAAAEPLPVALIGPGGMGTQHLERLVANPRVRLTTICEVDEQRAAAAAAAVTKATGQTPRVVKDMRRVFDDPAIRAVWIATPDHWHAPAAILAATAGKHVYVEKPCSHNLREGRLMIDAARRHNVVMQVGTQSRSTPLIQQAIAKLHEGAIGEVLVAKAWNSQRRGTIGRQTPSTPPAHLDYDLWLGPVPFVPYQSNFLPGVWRWWHQFGCGDIGNDGVHDIDIARWGLGVETLPTRVAALGGKSYFDDDQQHADTQTVVYEYAHATQAGRPKQLIFEQRIWSPYVQEGFENGNAWYGTEGLLVLGKRGRYQLFGPRNKLIEEVNGGPPDLAAHHNNFLDMLESGGRPNADIEINHLSTALCHLGNISTRVGRILNVDPAAETIAEDPAASALLGRDYRDHWATPRGATAAG
jgi:predicted dehydrogenase